MDLTVTVWSKPYTISVYQKLKTGLPLATMKATALRQRAKLKHKR